MNAPGVPGPDRGGSLTAPAGTAAAAGLTAPDDVQAVAAAPGGSLIEAVLGAFQAHRVVAIGDAHACQEFHDLLLTMLSDPRLYGTASDIIVEFGNAFYRDTLDKFILAGEPVSDASLRPVWRDTTQSPNITLDSPVYEQAYRRVRAVNWTLLTASWPDPAIYLDPVYWAELKRRNAIQAKTTRPPLDTFRERRPPAYPLPQAGPACQGADDT